MIEADFAGVVPAWADEEVREWGERMGVQDEVEFPPRDAAELERREVRAVGEDGRDSRGRESTRAPDAKRLQLWYYLHDSGSDEAVKVGNRERKEIGRASCRERGS